MPNPGHWEVMTRKPTPEDTIRLRKVVVDGQEVLHWSAQAARLYLFREGTGVETRDMVADAVAALNNTPTWAAGGLTFNGTNQWANPGAPVLLAPPFSIVARVSSSVGGTNNFIYSEGRSTTNTPYLGLRFAGATLLQVVAKDDLAGSVTGIVSGVYADGQPHMIAGVVDATSARAFLDGTAGTAVAHTLGAITLNRASIMAQYRTGLQYFAPGTIDELILYKFALTATQLAELSANNWMMLEIWVEDPLPDPIYLTQLDGSYESAYTVDPALPIDTGERPATVTGTPIAVGTEITVTPAADAGIALILLSYAPNGGEPAGVTIYDQQENVVIGQPYTFALPDFKPTYIHGGPSPTDFCTLFIYTVSQGGYSITAAVVGSGGTIVPLGITAVASGGSQSYSITPDAGYRIDDVVVDGTSEGAIAEYLFSNVQANHTISAAFAALPRLAGVVSARNYIDGSPFGGGQVIQ